MIGGGHVVIEVKSIVIFSKDSVKRVRKNKKRFDTLVRLQFQQLVVR